MLNEFKNKFIGVLTEKDVEQVYKTEFLNHYKDVRISSPYGTDGVMYVDGHSVLMEFKKAANLNERINQNRVLIQIIYYLKMFQTNSAGFPSAVVVGDEFNCFVLHTNRLFEYLKKDLDWSVSPSAAPSCNPELLSELNDDVNLLPFLFEIDSGLSIKIIADEIKKCCVGEVTKIKVTVKNFPIIFEMFQNKVLKTKTKGVKKLNPNERANLFLQLLINPSDHYPHPKQKHKLVTKSFGELRLNMDEYHRMFSKFEGENYTEEEKRKLTEVADRIIEEESRKNNGEFFTPPPYVDYTHKKIEEVFGTNWKNEYVVWDCACGLANLTRDYNFKELYLSTLHMSDINTIQQMKYNSNATLFQFDFLNDDDSKLPTDLIKAFEEKKVLFFINPPYASPSSGYIPSLNTKNGIGKTRIGSTMVGPWKVVSMNLYYQFLYRIFQYSIKYHNVDLVLYSPMGMFMLEKHVGGRDEFLNHFELCKLFSLKSGIFSNCGEFNLAVSLFKRKSDMRTFEATVVDFIDGDCVEIGTKTLVSIDKNQSAYEWVKSDVKGVKPTHILPHVKYGVQLKEEITSYIKVIDGFLGYIYNISNSVGGGEIFLAIYTLPCAHGHGQSIIPTNFTKATTYFSARRSVNQKPVPFYNLHDPLTIPNTQHELWEKYVANSLIYSIFDKQSHQCAFRNVSFNDAVYNVSNEFFWMSREQIKSIANVAGFSELYADAQHATKESHLYNLLHVEKLFDKMDNKFKEFVLFVNDLMVKSAKQRKQYHEEYPEFHLDAWDAGFYQMKHVWESYFPRELETLKEKYKELTEIMIPLTYDVGFLTDTFVPKPI